jgi:4-hydroxybenzoate polyprenyltransferase
MLKKIAILLEMIKFEHTVFALPFALASAVVAALGIPAWSTIGWIILAMVGARSSAMGFNRIADWKIDALNPRTQNRAIPAGLVTLVEAWTLVIASAVLFILASAMLNLLALELSPVALVLIFGYSYAKRFTSASHLILGLCLAIAPIGAWIAVRGTIEVPPLILGLAVMLWTAGFDILYSLQDVGFDRKEKLFSIPARFGETTALLMARSAHVLTAALLIGFGFSSSLGSVYFVGVTLVMCALVYEHRLVHPGDFSRINSAFFTMNGIVSIIFAIFTLADVLILNTLHN